MNKEEYIKGILDGNTRVLSKAITLAESQLLEEYHFALEIIESLPKPSNTRRIGITGSPGAGKSTFIDSFGSYLLKQRSAEKIAVLSIDPSSSISGGSILGDKTRMQHLSQEQNVYIRPSAAGSNLGGIARSSRLSVLLCEAAGYTSLFIESVGVGQAETELSKLCDLFTLLLTPGSGDDLQGIKRGIVEMADLLVVNKNDSGREALVRESVKDYSMAQQLGSAKGRPVMACSAQESTGFDAILKAMDQFFDDLSADMRTKTRKEHDLYWAQKQLKELVSIKLKEKEEQMKKALAEGELPERIALEISKDLFS